MADALHTLISENPMLFRLAAFVASVVAFCGPLLAQEQNTLTLDAAMARVVKQHPDLRLYSFVEQGLKAEADKAALGPGFKLNTELENAMGTGNASGLNGAEFTFSLASMLERGGKREARRALAASRIDAIGLQRSAKELDLLAEVARRYLDVFAAQEMQKIVALDLAQRERTVAAAAKRVQAGASHDSVRLTAEAMRARSRLEQSNTKAEHEAAWRRLVILWGDTQSNKIMPVAGDAYALPIIADFSILRDVLKNTPELKRFGDESRIRESRLQLARAGQTSDFEWQLGLRRREAESDWGFVAGVSMPIGNARRAEPDIRLAQAELDSLSVERESANLTLEATLAHAHGQFSAAKIEVEQIRNDFLPRLIKAEKSAENGYRAGALSYLEWSLLQNETTAARKQQLATALAAHRALIEIQRLTGEPMVLAGVQAGLKKELK
jgi:outer membrane protein, heavy metal efflux system